MKSFYKLIQKPLLWTFAIAFIIFYPMLISIYVFLPLLIGVMGYIFMRGLDDNRLSFLVISSLYFINLEANLSLPFFLTFIAAFLVYLLFYRHSNYFRKCAICRPILSVLLMDLLYLGLLLSYDFVFQTSSIVLDNMLIYTLVIDLLVVVLF